MPEQLTQQQQKELADRADEIRDRFTEFYEDMKTKHNADDINIVFQGWIFSELAKLQLVIEKLNNVRL